MRARRGRSQRLRSSKRVPCLRKSTRLRRFSATAVSGGGSNSARAGTDVSNEAVSVGRGSKSFLSPGRLNFVFNGPLPFIGRPVSEEAHDVVRATEPRLGNPPVPIVCSFREACFVLSWRAGAPTGGTSRDTAPAASGRRRRTQQAAPRPRLSAPPRPYRPPT